MNIETTVEKALEFLVHKQDASGSFEAYTAASINCTNELMEDFEFSDKKGWTTVDNYSVFPTILIGTSLVGYDENPKIQCILNRIDRFVLSQKHPFLWTWNHFTQDHAFFKFNPYDIDSTALALEYLRDRAILESNAQKRAVKLLLEQLNENGLFYTFFTFRGSLKCTWRSWILYLRELKSPISTYFFWKNVEAERKDIDGVVNANVIHYLGKTPITIKGIEYLAKQLSEGNELNFDKWYKTDSVVYYLISRLKKHDFEELKDVFFKWEKAILNIIESGNLSKFEDLDLALYANTLFNLGIENSLIKPIIQELILRQNSNGSWKRKIFYFGGPKKIMGWGCEELTTAICVSALIRYKNGVAQYSIS